MSEKSRVLKDGGLALSRTAQAMRDVRTALLETFATTHSLALQQSLFAMGEAVVVLPWDPLRDRVLLIDQFLPRFDAVESHTTIVRASPDRVWSAIRTADFGSNGIVRASISIFPNACTASV